MLDSVVQGERVDRSEAPDQVALQPSALRRVWDGVRRDKEGSFLLASARPTSKQKREAAAPVWGAQRLGIGVVLPRDTVLSLGEQNTTQSLALVQTTNGQEIAPRRDDFSPRGRIVSPAGSQGLWGPRQASAPWSSPDTQGTLGTGKI